MKRLDKMNEIGEHNSQFIPTLQKSFQNLLASIFVLVFLVSCSSFKTSLDDSGLGDMAKLILKEDFQSNPAELESYLAALNGSLFSNTQFLKVSDLSTEPLGRWDVTLAQGQRIAPQKLSLGSTPLFYHYRSPLGVKPEGEQRKAILWVPGFGVSDFAFNFIQKFFLIALEQGYDVLFYVLPYHLERTVPGKKEGEGLFGSDNRANLETVRNSLIELQLGLQFLKDQGITSIGAWGGSVGASYLMLLSTRYNFEHLAVMIPLLDWRTLLVNGEMQPVYQRFLQKGFSPDLLNRVYGLMSPWEYPLGLSPSRFAILYARLDQLTPSSVTLEYGSRYPQAKLMGYDESHTTILLNEQVYKDYGKFLAEVDPL